jgi:hypothetical protein
MMVEQAKNINFGLNSFPKEDRISTTLPRIIVTGRTVNYQKHCKLGFGEHFQTHEQHNNSMNPCIVGAIALRTTGNTQGTYLFFNRNTEKIISCN